MIKLASFKEQFNHKIYYVSVLQVGRTEMIKDSLNPDFVHKFIMDYFFEESQKLRFEM